MVNVTATLAGSYLNTVPIGALQTSGGNSTVSSGASILIVGAATTRDIPTLSEWAVIVLTLLLAWAGFAVMRRRKT